MTFLRFLFAMFLSFLPGLVGVVVTPISTGGNLWYNTLNVSSLTPAGWVFSVVWIVLYSLIGLALFMVIQQKQFDGKYEKKNAYVLFAINLVLNALWSFSFFGAQAPEAALVILTALIITVLFMARAFFKISRTAFWLIVPYILWLMFAFYLNGMIIYLN
ncbi:MAG: tryptophan-rich sensory protein [Alphaproteobacteria bacterium]|nr:tryptophan-rich sensory protein [Alphaproteobacteria bacterium]